MASLQSFMKAIDLAAQATQAAHTGIEEVQAGDINSGISNLINVAGSTAAAATNDTVIQGEAVAATQLALTIFPIFSNFFSLFKHKSSPSVVGVVSGTVSTPVPVPTTNLQPQPSITPQGIITGN